MRKTFQLTLLLVGLLVLSGATCNPNQQRRAYQTVYTAEQAATSAYSAYLDLVLRNQIQTNGLPSVSAKYNTFQVAAHTAEQALAFNPTNPAPPEVQAALTNLLGTIDAAKKGASK